MLKLQVFTTDQTFVDDLNAAGIEGIKAVYRPTITFNSLDHPLQIVLETVSATALKLAGEWIVNRFKGSPPKTLQIDNKIVNNAENVTIIINNFIVKSETDKKP